MQLSKNFTLAEFASRDGKPVPQELLNNAKQLAENLQVIRDYLGEPLHVNSAYRSPAHNKAVGGRPQSYHLKCLAADLTCKSKTPKQLKAVIELLISQRKIKQGGIGLYSGFIHYDIRGRSARW